MREEQTPWERAWGRHVRTVKAARELLVPLMLPDQGHNLVNVIALLEDSLWETRRECERLCERERERERVGESERRQNNQEMKE